MVIGDNIRKFRILKGLSQENMAEVLKISLLAYGDIERNKKDITLKRLEQIAKELGTTITGILNCEDKISNFFDQCNQPSVVAGVNNTQNNNYDVKEIQHQLDKTLLKLEKMELEAMYWKEKYENKI